MKRNGIQNCLRPCKISLKLDAKPYPLYSQTGSNFNEIRSSERTKLNGIPWSDILSSLWCPGMVVVPKSSGKVRICRHETLVMREFHPLPAVDETLAHLSWNIY